MRMEERRGMEPHPFFLWVNRKGLNSFRTWYPSTRWWSSELWFSKVKYFLSGKWSYLSDIPSHLQLLCQFASQSRDKPLSRPRKVASNNKASGPQAASGFARANMCRPGSMFLQRFCNSACILSSSTSETSVAVLFCACGRGAWLQAGATAAFAHLPFCLSLVSSWPPPELETTWRWFPGSWKH